MIYHGQSIAHGVRLGNLILVGLSGSGKSTIGRDLAWQLGLGFLDLDLVIENLKKKKLHRFF